MFDYQGGHSKVCLVYSLVTLFAVTVSILSPFKWLVNLKEK